MTTAGELAAFLQRFDPATPVVIDVNTDEGVYVRVEDLFYTSDEGDAPSGLEVRLGWAPDPGWRARLVTTTNEVREELGLPRLM